MPPLPRRATISNRPIRVGPDIAMILSLAPGGFGRGSGRLLGRGIAEEESDRSDHDLVAIRDAGWLLDPLASQEGSVLAVEVLDRRNGPLDEDAGMAA